MKLIVEAKSWYENEKVGRREIQLCASTNY
jgi:hypothetical protein